MSDTPRTDAQLITGYSCRHIRSEIKEHCRVSTRHYCSVEPGKAVRVDPMSCFCKRFCDRIDRKMLEEMKAEAVWLL